MSFDPFALHSKSYGGEGQSLPRTALWTPARNRPTAPFDRLPTPNIHDLGQLVINRGNALWKPLSVADTVWDGSVLRSRTFDDIYYSVEDGIAESKYVFIEGSALAERFAGLKPGDQFIVAELGFGTGLNFLNTLRAWRSHAPAGARLHYLGVDAHPLTRSQLASVANAWGPLSDDAATLHSHWPHPIQGCHRRHFDNASITLDLWWETATDALADLASHGRPWVDAWFLDGFAPAKNPDMWDGTLWHNLARLSRANATVSTFTSAGHVRRGLQEAGFAMEKREGFGRKRECLRGRIEQPPEPEHGVTPWDRCAPNSVQRVVVVGAGLAGAHVARALAQRGLKVSVLESRDIAAGGSRNRQGVTYTRLSRRFGNLSDFASASYQYALRRYHELFSQHGLEHGVDGEFSGYLQLMEETEELEDLRRALVSLSDFAQVIGAEDTATFTGIALSQGGLWYPEAAWLHPAAICQALLQHPNIDLQTGTGPVGIEQESQHLWRATDVQGDTLASGDHLIIATAWDTRQFTATEWLPLQVIRGQTTHIVSSPPLDALKSIICHRGYLPPAVDGMHCIGASFGPNDDATDERDADHQHNLKELMAAVPTLEHAPDRLGGQVALRCNSNDYLPISGPVPVHTEFAETYAALRSRSKQVIPMLPPVHPGLWCLTALGSRGLTAAPLAAEILASNLCDEPPPVPRYLQQAVSPARFLMRQLKRGQR